MNVKLNIAPILSYYTNNQKSVEVTGSTVFECLNYFIRQFPDLKIIIDTQSGKLAGFITIFLNKENAAIQDMNKPVKDGDELSIEYQPGWWGQGDG